MRVIRDYKSYEIYLRHQKEKTLDPVRREKWLGREWKGKVSAFKEAFSKTLGNNLTDKRCLGVCARTGQEIQAFKDLGGDAIGIDLVPCPPLVIEGDMHKIQFLDKTFDIVFSNSIDHSFSPEKFLREVYRVTKPDGLILLHLQAGKDLRKPGLQGYDICEISSSKEIIDEIGNVIVLVDRKINCLGSNWEVLLRKL